MRTFKNRFQDTQNTNYQRQGPTQNLNQQRPPPVGWPQSVPIRPIQYQPPVQYPHYPLLHSEAAPVTRSHSVQYQGQQQQPSQHQGQIPSQHQGQIPSQHQGQRPSQHQGQIPSQHQGQRPSQHQGQQQQGQRPSQHQGQRPSQYQGQRRRATKALSEIDVQRNNKLNEHLEDQLKEIIYTIPYNPSFGTNFIGYIQPSSKEDVASLVDKKSEKLQYIDKESKFFNVINENKGARAAAASRMSESIMSENLFKNFRFDKVFFEKYMNQNDASVYYTFRYLFYKFKKCIYIKIVNNEIDMFIPFTNINFVNEWHSLINIRNTFPKNRKEKNESILNFLSEVNNVTNRIAGTNYFIDRRKIHDVKKWYSNNGIFRHDKNETEHNIESVFDFFDELCKNREIPDMELFINRRDFPLLKNNETEAYDNIWGDNKPIVSHLYSSYCPILSMVTGEDYADIPIPTYDDWKRVKSDSIIQEIKWESKKNTAVFRGSLTGVGFDINTNMRLKAAYLNESPENKIESTPLLDAGITKFNMRPRKLIGFEYLEIPVIPSNIKAKKFMTLDEQAGYKYILNIDGHVSAYRLSIELSLGSVILLVESKWKLWYGDLLKENIHYISIKSDLSDLYEKIKWCRNNDSKCKKIAENAKEFYVKYLSKNSMFDYMQKILVDLHDNRIFSQDVHSTLSLKTRKLNENISSIIDIDNNIKFGKKQINTNLSRQLELNDIIAFDNLRPYFYRNNGWLEGMKKLYYFIKKMEGLFVSVHRKEARSGAVHGMVTEGFILNTFQGYVYKFKSLDTNRLHEAFAGLSVVNDFCRTISNFSYTYSYDFTNNNIISEYIPGITLVEYIRSNFFNIENYIKILKKISLALDFSQKNNCFIHGNLIPTNIIIEKNNSPLGYKIYDHGVASSVGGDREAASFRTVIIQADVNPIIINYRNSLFVYNKIKYSENDISDFEYDKDIRVAVLESLKLISKKVPKLGNQETGLLVNIANLFLKQDFLIENLYELNELDTTYSPSQYIFNYLTPIEFFKKIEFLFDINPDSFGKEKDFYLNYMDFTSSKYVFNLITDNKNPVEYTSYLLKKFKKRQMVSFSNVFLNYYAKNRVTYNLNTYIIHLKNYIKIGDENLKKIRLDIVFYHNLYEKILNSSLIDTLFSPEQFSLFERIQTMEINPYIYIDEFEFKREKEKLKLNPIPNIPSFIFGYYDILLSMYTNNDFLNSPYLSKYDISNFLKLNYEKILNNISLLYRLLWSDNRTPHGFTEEQPPATI